MAREKMFDPSYQKAFTEAIHKENQIRMKWHMQYGSSDKKSDAVNWEDDPSDDDDLAPAYDDTSRAKEFQWSMPSQEERAWPTSCAPMTNTIPRVSQPPVVMKPVERNVQQILYQGLSHDGEGRTQYLNRRCQEPPEERYYFPVCSSWEYGWSYGMDPMKFSHCPRHSK